MDERDFTTVEFMISFEGVSHIAIALEQSYTILDKIIIILCNRLTSAQNTGM